VGLGIGSRVRALVSRIPARVSTTRLRPWFVGGIVLAAGLALVLIALDSASETRRRFGAEFRDALLGIPSDLSAAEKAQRTYFLTDDLDHLRQFEALIRDLGGRVATLPRLARNIGLASEGVADLSRTFDGRVGEMRSVAAAYHRGGIAEALLLVEAHEAQGLSAQVGQAVARVAAEQHRLAGRDARQARLIDAALLFLLVAMFGGTLGLAALGMRRERSLNEALAGLNRDLESRIATRTAELEAANRRIEHLFGEMSHRIGNNLAMLSSYMLLAADRIEDAASREVFEEAQERVVGIAAAQRRLLLDADSNAVDMRRYLSALAADLRAVGLGSVAISLDAGPLLMRGDDAVALGIIVNELVTNALKHAFPDGEGRIAIRLATHDGEGALEVRDDGRGFGDGAEGMGSFIVQSMVNALGGRLVSMTGSAGGDRPGASSHIRFPLRAIPDEHGRAA